MSSLSYVIADFREKESVVDAIRKLRATGLGAADLDVFSEEPVEFHRGILDRPSHMSLVSVLGAIVFGGGATALVRLAQYNYAVNTGGMPIFSFWGTGVITYETTMMGAVLATFGYFLWESGLIRKRDKKAPIPPLTPECIALRVRCVTGEVTKPMAILRDAGAISIEKKVPE